MMNDEQTAGKDSASTRVCFYRLFIIHHSSLIIFPSFMQSSVAPRRGFYHVRFILLLTTLFTLLVAMMFRTTPIVVMASTLCAVMICSTPPLGTVIARFWSRGLTAQRQMPSIGQVGEIVSGRVILENVGKAPALLVQMRPGEALAQSGDAMPAVALLSDSTPVVPLLRGGDRFEIAPRWMLNRRGVFQMAPVIAGASDPLGLFASLSPRTPSHEIIVTPRPLRIERIGLSGGARHSPQIAQHANITAEALDFHGVRPWRDGEPIRRIHWKSTARTGALHIVEWEDSPGSDISVVFDASVIAMQPNGLDEAFETAITLIATVGAHCLENGYRFQLFCDQPNEDGEYSQLDFSADSSGDIARLLQTLARVQPLINAPDFAELARRAAPQIGRGAGALLLSGTGSDFLDALDELQSSDAASFHVLALDGATFQENQAPQRDAVFPDNVRLLRAGDSLTEALERLA